MLLSLLLEVTQQISRAMLFESRLSASRNQTPNHRSAQFPPESEPARSGCWEAREDEVGRAVRGHM